MPLLAKILIPVFGVLLVVVVGVAWCCCVRGKERENFENLIIESTLMVRNHSETDRAFDDKLSIKLKGIIKKKTKKNTGEVSVCWWHLS